MIEISRGKKRGAWRANWPARRILAIATATIGAALVLYPTAASWSSDRIHATEVSGYTSAVDAMPENRKSEIMEAARLYNEDLPKGPLRDPYALGPDGKSTEVGAGPDAYDKALNANGLGMMGRLQIPAIDVDLPVYHGTSASTLAKGIGHLYGSALPIGGEGTHAVLTGHSGLASATLLTNLEQLQEGDEFTVTVLDEVLTYKVDQILTVTPDDTEDLRPVDGRDFVTLITCTPTGVNTHRLLVRGERVPTDEQRDTHQMDAQSADPGFPWWAVTFAGVHAGSIVLTRPRRPGTRLTAPKHQ